MYKVLVVEDEPPLLNDIKYEIGRASDVFNVTMEAYNGSEALKRIKSEKPDVIFTDIRMPIIDGLQLIREVKQIHGDIPVVILSGYQDFKYAQEALKLGVFDYLLKPVDCGELKELLERLDGELKSNNMNVHREILSSALDNPDEIKPNIAVKNDFSNYCVFLIYSGTFSDSIIDYTNYMGDFSIKSDVERIVSAHLRQDEMVWSFPGNSMKEKILILGYNKRPYMSILSLAEIIKSSLESMQNFSVNISLTDPISDISEIGKSLHILRTLISKGTKLGKSLVITCNSLKEFDSRNFHQKCSEFSSNIVNLIQQNKKAIFRIELKKMLEMYKEFDLSVFELSKQLKHIFLDCQSALHVKAGPENDEAGSAIDEILSYSTSYEKLSEELYASFENFFSNDMTDASNKDLLKKVEVHLRENYRSDIDFKALADKYGFALPYLSKLFKKYHGVSPVEFVIQLKIEKAKDLILSDTSLFTKDISDYLGYSDQFYFSRIFKKITGKSPSEYKKIEGNQKFHV